VLVTRRYDAVRRGPFVASHHRGASSSR
jgi:hypothetical protein